MYAVLVYKDIIWLVVISPLIALPLRGFRSGIVFIGILAVLHLLGGFGVRHLSNFYIGAIAYFGAGMFVALNSEVKCAILRTIDNWWWVLLLFAVACLFKLTCRIAWYPLVPVADRLIGLAGVPSAWILAKPSRFVVPRSIRSLSFYVFSCHYAFAIYYKQYFDPKIAGELTAYIGCCLHFRSEFYSGICN